MKKLLLIILSCFACGIQICLADNSGDDTVNNTIRFINKDVTFKTRPVSRSNDEISYKDVTVAVPGTLADALGDEINDIDSLVVRGVIGDSDFYTLWYGTFYGKLSIINLEEAEIENGSIPYEAFWYPREQVCEDGVSIYVIWLKKIILPRKLKSIGEAAFAYAINLETIVLPQELESMGIYCFTDCISLNTSPLKLPEGLAEIPAMCFMNCKSLDEVILPSTIKSIEEGAFYSAKLKHIDIPDGLETIGAVAFVGSELEQVVLPPSCQEFQGFQIFGLNHKLKNINIPYGTKEVSPGFAYNDIELTEIDIPSTVEVIGNDAFWECSKLVNISLHEGLKEIQSYAFFYCDLAKELVIPSSVTYIGGAAFQHFRSLEAIYCSAVTPPTCDEDPYKKGKKHVFGPISESPSIYDTPNDIPVYVPIGTSSLYASAFGWNYFTNFIETDQFPSDSEAEVNIDKNDENAPIYDLMGRKVSQPLPSRVYIQNGKKVVLSE